MYQAVAVRTTTTTTIAILLYYLTLHNMARARSGNILSTKTLVSGTY